MQYGQQRSLRSTPVSVLSSLNGMLSTLAWLCLFDGSSIAKCVLVAFARSLRIPGVSGKRGDFGVLVLVSAPGGGGPRAGPTKPQPGAGVAGQAGAGVLAGPPPPAARVPAVQSLPAPAPRAGRRAPAGHVVRAPAPARGFARWVKALNLASPGLAAASPGLAKLSALTHLAKPRAGAGARTTWPAGARRPARGAGAGNDCTAGTRAAGGGGPASTPAPAWPATPAPGCGLVGPARGPPPPGADTNTNTPKSPRLPLTPGMRKDLAKATKTHLAIELPSNKHNQAKVLNIPFKELKTLTGVERSDRCWPYCITAMLTRTKGPTDAERRDTDEARNNFGLLYCPCHTSTGHTKPGKEMHEIPEALTTDVARIF